MVHYHVILTSIGFYEKQKKLKSVVIKFVKFSGVAFFLHNEAELQGLLSQ